MISHTIGMLIQDIIDNAKAAYKEVLIYQCHTLVHSEATNVMEVKIREGKT